MGLALGDHACVDRAVATTQVPACVEPASTKHYREAARFIPPPPFPLLRLLFSSGAGRHLFDGEVDGVAGRRE
jgi:hypothetical protein